MYSNFKAQAIEYVKEAVQEDNEGNYAKAFPLYMNALEYFKTHLKYERNPDIRDAISKKFTEYLRRAEQIRTILDSSGLPVTPPEPKSEGHGDNNNNNTDEGKDVQINYNDFFKAQAIEYVKQAVQEDNAGNYATAFPLYMNALEYFKTHLKYEQNPKIREAITMKFTEYLRRAEELRMVLDEGKGYGPSTSGDDVGAVGAQPKSDQGGNALGNGDE